MLRSGICDLLKSDGLGHGTGVDVEEVVKQLLFLQLGKSHSDH